MMLQFPPGASGIYLAENNARNSVTFARSATRAETLRNLAAALIEHGGFGDTSEVSARGSSDVCLGYPVFLPQNPPASVADLANWPDD